MSSKQERIRPAGGEDVAVVVRSSGERTEGVAVQAFRGHVPESCIAVIHERPFTRALARGLEIGRQFGLPWTLCVDADVTVRPSAVGYLLDAIRNADLRLFGATGMVFDKFYGTPNRGGPHLYRTSLIDEALEVLDAIGDGGSLRPETGLHAQMASRGYPWAAVDEVLAVHDFEQFYGDIYRKMVVRARKSPRHADTMLERSSRLAPIDPDFLVGAWGLRVGIRTGRDISLDAQAWRQEAEAVLTAHGMREKDPLPSADPDLLDHMLSEYAALTGVPPSRWSSWYRGRGARGSSAGRSDLTWRAGWLLTRAGMRLQRWAAGRPDDRTRT